jgi:glycosyltransferase involved in cell wall biosynthesis
VSARAFVESLDRQGVKAAYKYVYGPGTVFPVEEPALSDSYIVNMVKSRPFGLAKTQVVYAQGDVFERNTGSFKIGYTMLEVDGLPREWVRQANLMNEVWVPSEFNKVTFLNSGVKTPIHIIPLGVDPAYFSPAIVGFKPKSSYTFLSVFEWGERKAPEILIKAFSDEFKASEDVVLICKANNFDPSVDIKAQINKLNLRANGGRIVLAQNRILDRYELGSLYRSADCFVLPTRGEGWGMPILEAMACGLPVIATNWSSQQDFMTEDNSLPLELDGLIPAIAKCPYYEGFNWANPSYEHLRDRMRWVFENREKASLIGQRAADDVRVNWTWDQAVQKMINRINVI